MCPKWSCAGRRSPVNRPCCAEMGTISAGSALGAQGLYRELTINRLHTFILGQPPRITYYVIFDPINQLQGGVLRIYRLQEGVSRQTTEGWLPMAEIVSPCGRGCMKG